jgi:hypothetical protein
MSGIDRTGGHIGASQASRTASTMKAVGGAAFNVIANVGTAAAGVAGGPLAGAAASAAMAGLRGIGGSGGGSGGGGKIDQIVNQTNSNVDEVKTQAGQQASQAHIDSMELFRLQQAMNAQSQSFNMLTNMQKQKHDAAQAAIQNTR